MKRVKTKKENRIKNQNGVFGIISFIIIALYCLSLLIVLYWGFLTSFKYVFDFRANNFLFGFPRESHIYPGWYFENYVQALEMLYIEVPVKGSRKSGIFGVAKVKTTKSTPITTITAKARVFHLQSFFSFLKSIVSIQNARNAET